MAHAVFIVTAELGKKPFNTAQRYCHSMRVCASQLCFCRYVFMTCRIGDSYKHIVLGAVRFFAVVVVVGMVQFFAVVVVVGIVVVQVVGEAVQTAKHL